MTPEEFKRLPTLFLTNDFGSSVYYWEQNNPGMCYRDSHLAVRNYLADCSLDPNRPPNILETEKVNFIKNLMNGDVSKYLICVDDICIEYGEKCGLVNIRTEDVSSEKINLCDKLYGEWIYAIYEEKHSPLDDPWKKRKRCVRFYNDWILAGMNNHYLCGEINRDPKKGENDYTLGPFQKLAFNGLCFKTGGEDKPVTVWNYYSSRKFKLTASNLMYLYFNAQEKAVSYDRLFKDKNNERNFYAYLIEDIDNLNLIGLGWLPCLYAKPPSRWNEADRFVDFALKKKWNNQFDSYRNYYL